MTEPHAPEPSGAGDQPDEAPASADTVDIPGTTAPPPGADDPTAPPPGADPTPPPPDPPPFEGPAGPPPPEPPRRLTRRSDDRVLCGVASGLGDYFNVDPAIFRLGFVGLSFFGGSGVMLYLVGWIFLPERSTGQSVGDGLIERLGGTRSAATWLAVALVGLVMVQSADIFGGGLLWAAVLIGAGVLYFRQDESQATDEAEPPAATAAAPSSTLSRSVVPPPTRPVTRPAAQPVASTAPRPYAPDDWRPTPILGPPEPPPPPSLLGRITVATALIIVGLMALVDNLWNLSVPVDQYAAVATLVVGLGLLAGARVGHSRGLIVLGLALVATMALTAALDNVILGHGVGQRPYAPETLAELQDHYELGMGQLEIDLTELSLAPGDDIEIAGAVGVGQLVVDLPSGVSVDVAAESRVGSVDVLDRTSDGTHAAVTLARDGPEGSPTITLDLTAGLGEIEVHQDAPPPMPPVTPRTGDNP